MFGLFPKKQRSLLLHRYRLLILFLLTPFILNATAYEERFYKDKNHHPKGFGIHTDVGYSSYLIEVDSSELNSAIDYDILEFTLGLSYRYDQWMWGLYGKFLLNEIGSNMQVSTTKKSLNDISHMDKDEFALYTNYIFSHNKMSHWGVNLIYRQGTLKARDSYQSFYAYESRFKYQTEGIALSLLYTRTITQQSSWFLNVGVLYSRAEVSISEYVEHQAQDSFVEDSSRAVGTKLSMGYNHQLSNNLFFNIRMDGWRLNFGQLSVSSHIGDSLPKATLREESYSTYGGITWRF